MSYSGFYFLLIVLLTKCRGTGNPVLIVQRHHFASYLKRMAVVVRIEETFFAFVKVCQSFITVPCKLYYVNAISRFVIVEY